VAKGSSRAPRWVAVVVGALAVGALAVVPAVTAGAEPPPEQVEQADEIEAAVPGVSWGACPEGSLDRVPPEQRHLFSCATYPVPLDYDNPRKGSVDLALMRRVATDQNQRIGSMFLNPGGPGGSGFGLPTAGDRIFEPDVLARFDLIGFDPRGVARSTPLRCFTTQEEADEVFGRMAGVPVTDEQIAGTMQAYADYSDFCARNAGELLEHMSTKDVVRDLDLMRRAVGDKKLTYVGFSYGTLIGATYANMFPNKMRAIVIDGNVDPKLRTSDGVQYDLERSTGFEIALDAFLKRCKAEGPKCAFSEGDPRAKFDQMRDHLRTTPVTLPDGTVVTLDAFTGSVSGTLYDLTGLKALAEDLQLLYGVINPTASPKLVDVAKVLNKPTKLGRVDIRGDAPYESDDSYFAVNCTDKPMPKDPEAVPGIADKWEVESPTFGRYQAFADLAGCATWPLKEREAYTGPWDRKTKNPVLVIGNYYDPATQYEFSKRMASQLGNARLVSVDSFGHCILGDSSCADKITAKYLINLEVPEPGQVCQPDTPPF
jgi:pimeloyl-ACP methyl ester carboxylesterase